MYSSIPWFYAHQAADEPIQRINDLKAQLPAYLTAVDAYNDDASVDDLASSSESRSPRIVVTAVAKEMDAVKRFWEMWANNASCKFPAWVELARDSCTIGPSSAAAERVFSCGAPSAHSKTRR